MSLRGALLFCFLLASSAVFLYSQGATQNDATPTIKTNVRRVLVDVVVTDSKGEPVPGLKKEDFEVLEDGKAEAIATFEEHHGTSMKQIKLPPMPPNVYTNFPITQSADSVNVLLLDSLNTPAPDQVYVHSQMIKHLKDIPPNTRVAVFTLASRLRMIQGVTTDSSALLAAVNSQPGAQPSPFMQSQVAQDAERQRIDFMIQEQQGPPTEGNQTLPQSMVDAASSERMFLNDVKNFLADSRTTMTLEALQQLGRYLATIPGRKNVMWFSGSFPAGILPNPDLADPFGGERSFQEEIRKTSDLLTAAEVAIYPIGAEGLATDQAFQINGTEISQKRGAIQLQDQIQTSREQYWDRNASHASMEQVARETGGQAFYNVNGLGEAMARAVSNGQRYYSITYSPSNMVMDGKYRHIQLKLANGKHTLSYRRGYFADDLGTALASSQKPDADPLTPLMGRNLPDYTQILYKILVKPLEPQPPADAPRAGTNTDFKGPFIRYAIDFAVSVEDLRLGLTSDGFRHGNIEVMLVAYDPEGKPLNLVVNRSEIRMPGKDYANVRRQGLQIHKEIDVPAGNTFLRTGIYDLKSASAGTLGVPLAAAAVASK
ncbi:MAG: VWA domain-containing protein [Candidatus Sulfotelmatobacter sp.]